MAKFSTVVAVTVLLSLCCVAPAVADAISCGSSTATACPVNTGTHGETFTGTIGPGSTHVWYVFYATENTRLNTTLTDEENPACSAPGAVTVSCGSVTDDLSSSGGLGIGGAPGQSQPTGGMTAGISWSTPIPTSATYYLLVSGSPSTSSTGAQETTPYQLMVSATRTIEFPAPPMCIVPVVRGLKLSTAEADLRAAHCTVSRVNRVYSSELKSGLLLSLNASRGSKHPADYPVTMTVSRGPKPKR